MTDTEGIPPLLPAEDMPPIRTQTDLYDAWRALMGPLGFSKRSLWLVFIDADDRMTPVLMPIDDVPRQPDRRLLPNLGRVCEQVLDASLPGGSVAMLLSRPGRPGVIDSDRHWARALYELAEDRFALRPLHLATPARIVVLSRDDAASFQPTG